LLKAFFTTARSSSWSSDAASQDQGTVFRRVAMVLLFLLIHKSQKTSPGFRHDCVCRKSFVTTLPAPTIAFSPTVTLHKIVHPSDRSAFANSRPLNLPIGFRLQAAAATVARG